MSKSTEKNNGNLWYSVVLDETGCWCVVSMMGQTKSEEREYAQQSYNQVHTVTQDYSVARYMARLLNRGRSIPAKS